MIVRLSQLASIRNNQTSIWTGKLKVASLPPRLIYLKLEGEEMQYLISKTNNIGCKIYARGIIREKLVGRIFLKFIDTI